MSRRSFILCRTCFLASLLLLLAACSGDGSPRRIASYPVGVESRAYTVPRSQFIYNALIELEVSDPYVAAGRAAELAEENGGYLVSSQTTRWERREQVTVILAVPAQNFKALHAALLRLGGLRFERISGEWDNSHWGAYSEVTLTLLPKADLLPDLPGGWNPGRTLRRAFEVFLAVFGFLTDIFIWALVVVGPFALIGWIVWRLLRRRNRSSPPTSVE